MMSTVHQDGDRFVQYTKGAPDEVLKHCKYIMIDGARVELNEERRREVLSENKQMADKALRVLAGACRIYKKKPEDHSPEKLERDLTFAGLCGMIDPIRPEVKAAIEECTAAGITPVMITGDHLDTAVAIAKELGILKHRSEAVTGAQLDEMDDAQLDENIKKYHVYARVQPEHKVRIVKAWKKTGAITAMTGDGVNDAPSIKAADIGIGMGITGTDVTKNVADMILADDNFATIVKAVEEGRRIYDNIRKAVQFLLGSNLAEVVGVFAATLMGFTLLKPVHLLFINLITDCFPALALGMEKQEKNIMKRKPRDSKEGFFAGGMGADIAYQGILIAAITLFSYVLGHCMEVGYFEMPVGISPDGMTMAFLTLNMCEMFHSFNMRSQRGSIMKSGSHNKALYLSLAGAMAILVLVTEVPFIASLFGFTMISWQEFGIAMLLGWTIMPLVELVKWIQRSAAAK
jgi:Ca2+-transporting ATPase